MSIERNTAKAFSAWVLLVVLIVVLLGSIVGVCIFGLIVLDSISY